MAELFPKRCKVYPRNGMQFIPGILEKQKRIEFPAELPLSEKELRRCLSYADVYEVTGSGDVLLTMLNFMSDNSKATPAKDVPEDELQYPRDKKEEEDEEEEEADLSTHSAVEQVTAKKAVTYSTKQDKNPQSEPQAAQKQQESTPKKEDKAAEK